MDLNKLYDNNPEFKKLKPFMQTKLNWKYISKLPLKTKLNFLVERIIHYSGKLYFNLTKSKEREWIRLEDTKELHYEKN